MQCPESYSRLMLKMLDYLLYTYNHRIGELTFKILNVIYSTSRTLTTQINDLPVKSILEMRVERT